MSNKANERLEMGYADYCLDQLHCPNLCFSNPGLHKSGMCSFGESDCPARTLLTVGG